MRTFKLWTKDYKNSYLLTNKSITVTNATGLGFGVDYEIEDFNQNFYVSSQKTNFDNIELSLTFGIDSEGYFEYNNFISFISMNGLKNNLILEYTFNTKDTTKTLYCDVVLGKLPKSEKTKFRVISEQLTLRRLSYFYTQNIVRFGLGNNLDNTEIPFEFPMGFFINSVTSSVEINNTFFEPISLNVFIYMLEGQPQTRPEIFVKDVNGNTIERLYIYKLIGYPERIFINADIKRVEYITTNSSGIDVVENGYRYIYMLYNCFLTLPVGVSIISLGTDGQSSYQVFIQYKEKVLG